MRTTLTLDDDVAVRLDRLRRGGRTMKEVVNEALRAGLDRLEGDRTPKRRQYTTPVDLGPPLVDVTDVSDVLDLLDEDEWRSKLH